MRGGSGRVEASEDRVVGWDRRSAKGCVGVGWSAGLALIADEADPIGPLVQGYVGERGSMVREEAGQRYVRERLRWGSAARYGEHECL